MRDVTVRIRIAGRVQRSPGTDVAPAGIQGHDHGVRGLLHNGIVDRVGRAGFEERRIDAREVQIRLGSAEGGFADTRHLGREALQFLQVASRAEQEHSAVPVVVPRGHELAGALGIGFLHEARDAEGRAARLPALDVPVAGLGRARDDAEGCQLAALPPPRARFAPLDGRPLMSRITWSAGSTSSTGSTAFGRAASPLRTACAASAIAGAVLRPKGSSTRGARLDLQLP